MKFLAIFFIFLMANKTNGFYVTDRKCGDKLTDLMWTVCGNNFNSMTIKRSGQPALTDESEFPYESSSLANIYLMEAGNLLAKTRRMRFAGIADECCKKSCTLNELVAYCN